MNKWLDAQKAVCNAIINDIPIYVTTLAHAMNLILMMKEMKLEHEVYFIPYPGEEQKEVINAQDIERTFRGMGKGETDVCIELRWV